MNLSHFHAMVNAKKELRLTKKALKAAEDFIFKSPCDPDINPAQAIAYKQYCEAREQLTVFLEKRKK